jgi:hypothetical protein
LLLVLALLAIRANSFVQKLRIDVPHVIPVFHNVLPGDISSLHAIAEIRPLFSLSLRRPESAKALKPLLEKHKKVSESKGCLIGASTVHDQNEVNYISNF